MFTGIIEEKGKILKVIKGRVRRLDIQSGLKYNLGDSVAIQGICLTVAGLIKNGFTVEVVAQTQDITTLDKWRTGDCVNLERALKIGDRLAGHMVLGHIDETGKLIRIKDNSYQFQIDRWNAKYLVMKGSIAIDGVSLTISSIVHNLFSVALVPHTLKNTTLAGLRVGAFANIEYDYLVKIVKNGQ